MTDPRCTLTELLVDQCACRNHRGGQIVDLDDTIGPRIRDDTYRSRPFAAADPGKCSCGTRWNVEDLIMYTPDGELVGAQCCTGDL